MELQKGAEDSQNKEKVNDFHEVIMPQKPKNTKLKNRMTAWKWVCLTENETRS